MMAINGLLLSSKTQLVAPKDEQTGDPKSNVGDAKPGYLRMLPKQQHELEAISRSDQICT